MTRQTEPEYIYNMIPQYFENGDILGAKELVEAVTFRPDSFYPKIVMLGILMGIFETEVNLGSNTTVFDDYGSVEALIDKYIQVKLFVHRVEFNTAPETFGDIYSYCNDNSISFYFLNYLISHNTVYTRETYKRFADIFFQNEGEQSLTAILLLSFAEKS